MATARVTLTRALTHDARGRKFVKGQPQIIDNESDIAYYKKQYGFSVTMLRETKPKAAPTAEPEPPDEDEHEDEPIVHTRDTLGNMTKMALMRLAGSPPYDLALSSDLKKSEMIDNILEAQDIMSEGEDEHEDGEDE